MSDPFIGEINLFAGNFAPRGWAFCAGQLLSISQNTALFALVGTTYGGDGRTSFGLPDLRSRAVVGAGNGPGLSPALLGQRAGAEAVTVSQNQLSSHTHDVTSTTSFDAQSGAATQHTPAGGALAEPTVQGTPGMTIYSTQASDTSLEGASVSGALQVSDTGNSTPHENMQPFLGLNYIIAIQGTFPSRN
jgi:microcystin-dependent protein